MLMPMKQTSSSDTTLECEPERTAARPVKAGPKSKAQPTDADAQRALAWVARGQPQGEIAYDETAPKQGKADLRRFRRASYR